MTTPRPMTRFSTVAEVAALLRVSKMSIHRLLDAGELPGFRVGRSIRIPTVAVWQYLDSTRTDGEARFAARDSRPVGALPEVASAS